jgi:hypothetical protein
MLSYVSSVYFDPPPLELETLGMITALEDSTRSPTRLKIPRDRIVQADVNGKEDTNEPRQRREEEEAAFTMAKTVSASTQAPCVTDVSQETQEVEKNSKVDDKKKEEVPEAYTTYSTNNTTVSASTHGARCRRCVSRNRRGRVKE